MARAKAPQPNLNTPADLFNKVERYKLDSQGVVGALPEHVRDQSAGNISDESEQLAKSHGIYLEYNRAKTGRDKDWLYMVRVTVPGGGSFTAKQWRAFDAIADKYCQPHPGGVDEAPGMYGSGGVPWGPSIRLTTRQNIQYHWLRKPDLVSLVQDVAATGFSTLNGCGDNVRNVMACPLSKFSNVYDANAMAHDYGSYFRLPVAPHIQVFAVDPNHISDAPKQYAYGPALLNRKFKIAFSALRRNDEGQLVGDNCVEARACEIGVAPVVEGENVVAYQVYIGGGQGEKNGKPTFACQGLPFAVFKPDDLFEGMKAIVDVHKHWGDRENRVWARMKYVVQKKGIAWYQDEVRALGAKFEMPDPAFDLGPRLMHHGWETLDTSGKLAYGLFIENGRLIDPSQGSSEPKLKSMVPDLMARFNCELMITANQDLVLTGIDPDARNDFDAAITEHGYGKRKGKTHSTLRVLSGACVALPTCRLAYTDSEQWEPILIDELESRGYGDMHESIGVTGCERQCFRPASKTLAWIGQGPDQYALKLGGSEDGRYQGKWLTGPHPDKPDKGEQWFLRRVTKDEVIDVTAALFDFYLANKQDDEDMGAYHRRIGQAAILDHLRSIDALSNVFKKSFPPPFQPYDECGNVLA